MSWVSYLIVVMLIASVVVGKRNANRISLILFVLLLVVILLNSLFPNSWFFQLIVNLIGIAIVFSISANIAIGLFILAIATNPNILNQIIPTNASTDDDPRYPPVNPPDRSDDPNVEPFNNSIFSK